MSHIEITPAVWTAEEKAAESYRATHDDHLPPTPFWRLVDEHYLIARDTGHLARFEHNHGWKITCWEEQNHAPSSTVCVPSVPVQPVLPCPLLADSIPEPCSIVLLGMGILTVFMGHRWRSRAMNPRKLSDLLAELAESRQLIRDAKRIVEDGPIRLVLYKVDAKLGHLAACIKATNAAWEECQPPKTR